jgi:RNA polymerase sigma-70 factor (ECF subfamily)
VENDQELIALILAGDQDAFTALVELYQRPVFNLAFRMLNDAREAEDAAQEAFLRAYQHLDRYDRSRSFKTWLLSIASNHCIDRIRRRRLTWLSIDEPLPPHPALASDETEPEDATLMSERDATVQGLLDQLAPEYKAAVVLRYWHDLSYTEIAELLDTTESAIKSRLFRARQMMAENLRGEESQAVMVAVEGV